MDDDESENLCPYGTPLEPLQEDEIPTKKPTHIEDQIVTDSNGRRRFHGAFTGGFSAGFWNTVGSLEGWKPQNFKSSRSEKAKQLEQKPIDFMDDEDLGEFGIAPQRIQTTEDFTPQNKLNEEDKRKRKLQHVLGPIPGVPVLHQLLEPAKENVAIRMLKKMSWKPGQGVGARQTRKEKKLASKRNARAKYVMKKYGCDLGPLNDMQKSSEDDEESSDEDQKFTFAPDDFETYTCSIKDNLFGLGYCGLNSNSLSDKPQHVNLFDNAFEVMGKNNKKLSIRGQAFGVGALEDDDENIYAQDDLTRYDFSLENKKSVKPAKVEEKIDSGTCIEGFRPATDFSKKKKVFTVNLPLGFRPRNWAVRKSRFEPLSEEKMREIKQQNEYKIKGLGRHDLDPEKRGRILGESVQEVKKKEAKDEKKTYLEKLNEKYESEGIQKTSQDNAEIVINEAIQKENEKIQKEAQKITQNSFTKPGTFKPFLADEAKQERYEKFLEANLTNNEEISKFLTSIQPLSMSKWDSEMEKKEFLQARNIYRPLMGLMFDRFISESIILTDREESKIEKTRKKKFEVKRTKTVWKPCTQLCKRFNVPEPFGGTLVEEKKQNKSRFSVFDYLEVSVNKKDNFVTPVIIPKIIEKPKPIISQDSYTNKKYDNVTTVDSTVCSRSPSKDIFMKDINNSQSKVLLEATTSKNIDEFVNPRIEVKEKFKKSKTELEKRIEESKDKHPSEKIDIFKAIFESSDEEEKESDFEEKLGLNKEDKSKETTDISNQPSTSTNISRDIYTELTKPATEFNILRNTSPPRGIFANLFIKKPETVTTSTDQKQNQTLQQNRFEKGTQNITLKNNELESYGPKLANIETFKLENNNSSWNNSSSVELNGTDKKLLKMLKKSKDEEKTRNHSKKSKNIEKWIEKPGTKDDKKKKKKKKKDKKKKSEKHKKHKKSRR